MEVDLGSLLRTHLLKHSAVMFGEALIMYEFEPELLVIMTEQT
jgi:hypothetical protein